MLMKKTYISVAAVLLLLLGACGSKKEETKELEVHKIEFSQNEETGNHEETVEDPGNEEKDPEEDPEGGVQENVSEWNVRNNFSYFVQVGDKVYFRVYGQDALERGAIWGNYLTAPTGAESAIYSYNESTGEVLYEFADYGYGEIVFMGGNFYMTGMRPGENGYDESYLYAVTPNGEQVALDGDYAGSLVGVSEDCEMFFLKGYHYESGLLLGDYLMGFYTDGEPAFTLESTGTITYMGTFQDHIVYLESDYETGMLKIQVAYLPSPGYELGGPYCMWETEYSTDFGYVVGGEYLASDLYDEEYISLEEIAGSGNFFNHGNVISFLPWEEGSGENAAELTLDEYMEMPYIHWADNGGICFSEKEYDTYFQSEDYEGTNLKDVCYRGYFGEENVLIPDFLFDQGYYEERERLFLGERILDSDYGYIMCAREVYDEDASIGWRDGYRLLQMDYYRVSHRTGEYELIASVEYE